MAATRAILVSAIEFRVRLSEVPGVWSLCALGFGGAWACAVALVVYVGARDFRRALRAGRMVGRSGEVYNLRTSPGWFWAHLLQSAAVWLFVVAFLAACGVATVWLLGAFGAG